MKVKDLIYKLAQFNPELEVTITDGMNCVSYTTNDIEIKEFTEFKYEGETTLDIGIGGNQI